MVWTDIPIQLSDAPKELGESQRKKRDATLESFQISLDRRVKPRTRHEGVTEPDRWVNGVMALHAGSTSFEHRITARQPVVNCPITLYESASGYDLNVQADAQVRAGVADSGSRP